MAENNNSQDPNDSELFRQAMKEVVPAAPKKARKPHHPPPLSEPMAYRRFAATHFTEQPTEKTHEIYSQEVSLPFRREGVQKSLLRKIQQRKIPIEARLDLHGLKPEQALDKVQELIEIAKLKGLRLICVVHGKGSGRLKQVLTNYLYEEPNVLACSAAGEGAIDILIKLA